ncbi:SDR family oxidoreductase [Rhodococcus sp. T2V]|uniref:SDR family oxidoreductase n=1 Tax=Rhodococcus sp. T2V TaxID=3034164 RepID=UPI0023E1976A|nr:SDR family oxidoreductase [Rhodococcus sp. T2V]MDF3309689.1 SDR family oxidoreductase [Rhodococcus sp. T2V]
MTPNHSCRPNLATPDSVGESKGHNSMMRLDGKVALITGAARGQGASHAKYLAREGARIVAVDILADVEEFYPNATAADMETTVETVRAEGGDILPLQGDVRDSNRMREIVDQSVERFGTIDIVCNNAGTIRIEAIDEMTDHTLDVVVDTCLKGVFNVTRAVVPVMKRQRAGSIVNTASAGAIKAVAYSSHYAAAKGGVILATRSWARELAEWDINVNAVAPGSVYTGMITGLAGQAGEDPLEAFARHSEANLFTGEKGRLDVDDISRAIAFLASDDARTITGQTLVVDAGWAA